MFFRTAADDRPYHLGRFPLETLPRDDAVAAAETGREPASPPAAPGTPEGALARAARAYLELFVPMLDDEPAPARAPVPDEAERRMADLKGYAYFMNASQVGICRIPERAWLTGSPSASRATSARWAFRPGPTSPGTDSWTSSA
jgi:hypothetical protein